MFQTSTKTQNPQDSQDSKEKSKLSVDNSPDFLAQMMKGNDTSQPPSTEPMQLMVKEEEEPRQGKVVQKANEEEEELIQGKIIQKQEEEEEVQAKPVQMQEEEEEEIQAKVIQKQGVDEEEEMQMKPDQKKNNQDNSGKSVSTGSKTGMPADVKSKMEGSFGTDFSNVNIHKDDARATDMGALAYTQGNDVHFAPGQYNPGSQKGQELLGHELTHVVQQRQGRVQATKQGKGFSVNDNPGLENEADVMGERAAQGKVADVNGKGSGTMLEENQDSVQEENEPWADYLNISQDTLKNLVFESIRDIFDAKEDNLDVWSRNAKIEDFMPGDFALELVLSIVGASLGGAIGSMAAGVFAEVASKAAQSAISSGVKKLTESSLRSLVNIVSATSTTINDDLVDGKSTADQVDTGSSDYYTETMRAMFKGDMRAQRETFAFEVDSMSHEGLAILNYNLGQTVETLENQSESIFQEITIGYFKLQDLCYIQEQTGLIPNEENEAEINDFYRNDGGITETEKRDGQILITGPLGGIGEYSSPNPSINNAIITGVNESTYKHLKGVTIEDLPFSIGFRFWGSTPGHNVWNIFESSLCKVWFIKDTFGRIWVDHNESGEIDSQGYNQGREWLARHYLSSDQDLTRDGINRNAPYGARKIYDSIKSSTLDSVFDMDLFK